MPSLHNMTVQNIFDISCIILKPQVDCHAVFSKKSVMVILHFMTTISVVLKLFDELGQLAQQKHLISISDACTQQSSFFPCYVSLIILFFSIFLIDKLKSQQDTHLFTFFYYYYYLFYILL